MTSLERARSGLPLPKMRAFWRQNMSLRRVVIKNCCISVCICAMVTGGVSLEASSAAMICCRSSDLETLSEVTRPRAGPMSPGGVFAIPFRDGLLLDPKYDELVLAPTRERRPEFSPFGHTHLPMAKIRRCCAYRRWMISCMQLATISKLFRKRKCNSNVATRSSSWKNGGKWIRP